MDAQSQRAAAEEKHEHFQVCDMIMPPRVESIAPGHEIIKVFPVGRGGFTVTGLQSLQPTDCRDFCHRETAIYLANVPITDYSQLFDGIYHAWYPRRSRALDISFESFFSRAVRLFRLGPSTQELFEFHQRLCRHIQTIQHEIPPPRRPRAAGPPEMPQGGYKLNDIFKNIFIFIDRQAWREEGVLLVSRNRDVIAGVNPIFDVVEYESNDNELLGKITFYSCRTQMKQAVDAVLAQIPDSISSSADESEFYREQCEHYKSRYGSLDRIFECDPKTAHDALQ